MVRRGFHTSSVSVWIPRANTSSLKRLNRRRASSSLCFSKWVMYFTASTWHLGEDKVTECLIYECNQMYLSFGCTKSSDFKKDSGRLRSRPPPPGVA